MPSDLIVDPSPLDFDQPLATVEEIRRVNPHRYEMEQLTAILFIDSKRHVIVGYKDVRLNEFWIRGHMPDYPTMPGTLLCEAAAQLCSYYITTEQILCGDLIAITGLQNVRFLEPVLPGHRLVVAGRAVAIRQERQATFATQGIVQGKVVFEVQIFGAPLTKRPRRRIAGSVMT